MAPYIGRRMRRVEDERLITGRGRFAGDIKLEGLLHIAFCRSVLPHARIGAIDASTARSMPGVLAVWTADDLPEVAGGLTDFGPQDLISKPRPVLNRGAVNYTGEAYPRCTPDTRTPAPDAPEQVSPALPPAPASAHAPPTTTPRAD